MPYNNTPITPSKEVTGHVSLPLARVQKIIQADPERLATSKNASFAIALAAEMFIQHLATTTHNVVKAERKPRRNIQYRDVSAAVGKTDNLEFLVDVVPRTVTWREFKKRQGEKVEGREKAEGKEKEGKEGGKKATKGETAVVEEEEAEMEAEAEVEKYANVNADPNADVPVQDLPEAMDVEQEPVEEQALQRVQDSEPEPEPEPEKDEAALQIEMEISLRPSGSPRMRRSGGFTAINGK
ncbi:hypothetical protein P153DRAFT_422968 [Dothidotthia symphoricarpi CBS 119687]|uniref:Transcription factor CBF/NF-Y/archaeal histone domain-containing protein n=1 Tax=Dothidotthia symphoricarpi CBS 119687 TaxID=1392245 RepID=A0A6A6ADK2_9PLEO|nr:uncharacterized protein P153DRAFT_422968 [Dothidotthia symphoricarpi CBS 119687]KAF2129343.1 hypothetical protein P153DRAFT_422968 [Dothidotthia symphoricarpi CBS 119687]